MNKLKSKDDKIIWLYWMLGTTFAVYLSFRFILPLILPFLVAFMLAKLIYPCVDWLNKKCKIPKRIGCPFILLFFVGLITSGMIWIATTLFSQTKNIVKNIPIYRSLCMKQIDTLCQNGNDFFCLEDGVFKKFVDDNLDRLNERVSERMMPMMTERILEVVIMLAGAFAIAFIIFISVLLIVDDWEGIHATFHKCKLYENVRPVTERLFGAGLAYLRAQLILTSIVTVICSVGLFVIGNKYALLFGIGIAIFDAFPILGSGSILVPWGIVEILQKNFASAATLFTLYICCLVVRQLLEPRLIGNKIGIKPIYTIMSAYIGIQLLGITGVLFGPFALVMILTILEIRPS